MAARITLRSSEPAQIVRTKRQSRSERVSGMQEKLNGFCRRSRERIQRSSKSWIIRELRVIYSRRTGPHTRLPRLLQRQNASLRSSTQLCRKCQDELMDEQITEYAASIAKTYGSMPDTAMMECINIIHQGGSAALKRILAKTAKPYTAKASMQL